MRVVVDEGLEFRAGQAFNDDGTVRDPHPNNGDSDNYVPYDSNSSFFDPGPSGGLEDIDADDLPVATVNRRDQNVNEDVKIQVATDVDTTSVRFYDILEIVNNSADRVEVGIKYEDDQYGDDVDVGGNTKNNINELTVQHEGVIELLSHRDDRAPRIVSAFVVGDSDDEAKAQSKKYLRPCVDAASGVRSPEAAVLH